MKKLFNWGVIALVLLMVSCTKSIQEPNLTEISKNSTNLTTIQASMVNPNECIKSISSVGFDGDMLVFQSGSHFTQVMQCLAEQVDAYEDNFENQTISMTDDQANDYAHSLNYDEDQPLINFENNLGFYSLRAKLSAATDQWLDNPVLDENNNPDNNVVVDDILRALLNVAGKVKVANQVYDFINPSLPIPDGGASCWLLGRTLVPPKKYDNDKKQLWVRTSLVGIPFGGYSVAKVKGISYRLARGGRAWEKFRTDLTADVGGIARDGLCDNIVNFGNIKTRKRSSKIICRYFSFNANNYISFPYWYAKNNDFSGLVQSGSNANAYYYVPIKMIWY